jgi:shikimate kinase
MSRYVIVSGVPAAGKSAVAAGLAAQSSLRLFDKDQYLEALFASEAPRDPAERRALSIRADRELENAVRSSPEAVVVSWWRHPNSVADSGTPVEWLRELRGGLIEVYCECAPEVAVARFRSRKRHPSHMDQRWSNESLLAQIADAARLGPLNVGALVRVNSETAVDFGELWNRVESAS